MEPTIIAVCWSRLLRAAQGCSGSANVAMGELEDSTEKGNPEVFCFAGYEVNRQRWQLRWHDEVITLARKPFDLLLYLTDHRERVVSKGELLEALWPDQFVDENNLAQQISVLRRALSKHASGERIIETVPGRGYRFVADITSPRMQTQQDSSEDRIVLSTRDSTTRTPLREVPWSDLTGARHTADHSQEVQRRGAKRLRVALAVGGLLALLVAGAFALKVWKARNTEHIQVAILPMDGSTGDQVLDRALSDSLRSDFLQSPFLALAPAGEVTTSLQQMKKAPGAPLGSDAKIELCERTNSQAVVHVGLARSGSHFLLTGELTDCVHDRALTIAKSEAVREEDLPNAVDQLTNALRRKLGESRRSIEHFNAELLGTDFADTPSLDALKAVSEARRCMEQGRVTDAINLLQRATSLDPNYALAYLDLAADYSVLLDEEDERLALQKAFDLRNTVNPLTDLMIRTRYETILTGDLYQAKRDFTAWTHMYPQSVPAWNGLNIATAELGERQEALVAAKETMRLRPTVPDTHTNVAENETALGDYQGALLTCRQAIASGLDSEKIHYNLIRIAVATRDTPLLQSQFDWIASHPNSPLLIFTQAEIAISEGRFRDALRLAQRSSQLYEQSGLASVGGSFNKVIARELIEAGALEDGGKLFRAQKLDVSEGDDIDTLAMLGGVAQAERLAKDHLSRNPNDTLWKEWFVPLVGAEVAMAGRKSQEAMSVMEPTRALDGRENSMALFRGNLALKAGQSAKAATEFQIVLSHAGLDPTTPTVVLAQLGLARSLAAEGDKAGAIRFYKLFLGKWTHADADAMLLRQAHAEAGALGPPSL